MSPCWSGLCGWARSSRYKPGAKTYTVTTRRSETAAGERAGDAAPATAAASQTRRPGPVDFDRRATPGQVAAVGLRLGNRRPRSVTALWPGLAETDCSDRLDTGQTLSVVTTRQSCLDFRCHF